MHARNEGQLLGTGRLVREGGEKSGGGKAGVLDLSGWKIPLVINTDVYMSLGPARHK